jgi:hypothetical protein
MTFPTHTCGVSLTTRSSMDGLETAYASPSDRSNVPPLVVCCDRLWHVHSLLYIALHGRVSASKIAFTQGYSEKASV